MPTPHFDAQDLTKLLPLPDLIDAIDASFRSSITSAERTHLHTDPGTLLIMPSWDPGAYIGVKLVTIMPENRAQGLSTLHGLYALFDGLTGKPVATMDGRTLTLLRTGAASAVASRVLAPSNSSTLLMVGAGDLAPYLVRSHAAVRPIEEVLIWNRSRRAAEELRDKLNTEFARVAVVDDLSLATRASDIVSCATQATVPLIKGSDLKPDSHLDLVGAFTPEMCEADADCFVEAEIVVDLMEGAQIEAGDLIQAIGAGRLSWSDISSDLRTLLMEGRKSPRRRSVFKSVGAAQEDLAGAVLALQRSRQ